MLIIASPEIIERSIQLSMDDNCAVAKNAFYLEAKQARASASVSTDSDNQNGSTYIVLPYELVSILKGCNFIAVKGYKLQEDENGSYRAVQQSEKGKIDLVINGKIFPSTRTDYPLEFDIGHGHKLILSGTTAMIGTEESTINCERDINPEYEGTPAECYRYLIPAVS